MYDILISGVHLTLKNKHIPNNGTVAINEIGSTDETALLCHTNNPPSPDTHTSGGDWFGPDGTRVGDVKKSDVPGFVRNRSPNVVRLKRSSTTTPSEGIYKCVIQDDTRVNQTVYVRLYGKYVQMYTSENNNNVLGLHTVVLQSLHHPCPLQSIKTQSFNLTLPPMELTSSPGILPSPRELASVV